MSKSFKIGLLFEKEKDILNSQNYDQIDTLYHWREPEEIDAVSDALEKLGCDVQHIGTLDQLLEFWKQGQTIDLAWNLSVRTLSRNRTALAPALLEQLNIPYTGADATAKSFLLNKELMKPFLRHHNISTPDWKIFTHNKQIHQELPWSDSIVKPVCEGYSLGLKKFSNLNKLTELKAHITKLIRQFNSGVMCEELIPGREITISIIDGISEYGAVEIVTQDGKSLGNNVLDTEAKRFGGFEKVAVNEYDEDGIAAYKIAAAIMELLTPIGYASFDFRITEEGDVYLIDINPDATLHPERSFVMGFNYNQVDYESIISSILTNTLQRWGLQQGNSRRAV